MDYFSFKAGLILKFRGVPFGIIIVTAATKDKLAGVNRFFKLQYLQ
jgi:hypothetical protein